MCRNIKRLFNFAPPATEDEIRAASAQFVRKVSGTTRPSRANQAAFDLAVEHVQNVVSGLLKRLETTSTPLDREVEASKAREKSKRRFG